MVASRLAARVLLALLVVTGGSACAQNQDQDQVDELLPAEQVFRYTPSADAERLYYLAECAGRNKSEPERLEAIRHLEQHGCALFREGSNHTMYWNPQNRSVSAVSLTSSRVNRCCFQIMCCWRWPQVQSCLGRSIL